MTIDLRMFDVGLGSAILIELDRGFDMVRILADGGDHSAGLKVEAQLATLWARTGRRPTIDLVIGTHYDADHLDGLTVLFQKGRVEVVELWLPPVLDDTDERENNREPRTEASLVRRFSSSQGGAAFLRYLDAKRARLALLNELEGEVPSDRLDGKLEGRTDVDDGSRPLGQERLFFEREVEKAVRLLGERGGEHDRRFDVLANGEADFPYRWRLDELSSYEREHIREMLQDGDDETPDRSPSPLRLAIAARRLAAATDGINACALRSLLLALPDPAPRIRQWWSEDDQALTFGWDSKSRAFNQGCLRSKTRLTLLGPTERLVVERRDKLPRFTASFIAKRWDRLEGLSESNQLSYVVRLDHDGQGVLITGDSGFDGFAIGSDRVSKYELNLVSHLKELAVVQVPHHGGINRHFYRVLDKAGFTIATGMTYLLLSHEPDSAHRPNGAFASYMMRLPDGRAKVLFTGQPAAENIKEYEQRVAGPVPESATAGGEVRLSFGTEWKIKAHGRAR